jgi:hypothetical protein
MTSSATNRKEGGLDCCVEVCQAGDWGGVGLEKSKTHPSHTKYTQKYYHKIVDAFTF